MSWSEDASHLLGVRPWPLHKLTPRATPHLPPSHVFPLSIMTSDGSAEWFVHGVAWPCNQKTHKPVEELVQQLLVQQDGSSVRSDWEQQPVTVHMVGVGTQAFCLWF